MITRFQDINNTIKETNHAEILTKINEIIDWINKKEIPTDENNNIDWHKLYHPHKDDCKYEGHSWQKLPFDRGTVCPRCCRDENEVKERWKPEEISKHRRTIKRCRCSHGGF